MGAARLAPETVVVESRVIGVVGAGDGEPRAATGAGLGAEGSTGAAHKILSTVC